MRTPLVIAMWEPMARALGYPKKKLGFADVLRLATSGKGWADFGRPEFGEFKLVHTSPDFSTSGLSAVVAEYYAATGKKEGLTEKDIAGGAARKRVRDIERSIVHYGDTTLFIAEPAQEGGPGLRERGGDGGGHAARLQPRPRGGRDKLVAIYPEEGTFDSDSPFFTLKAPWVSPAAGRGREGVPGVPGRRDHAGGRGQVGLPPRQPRDRAGGARSRPPTAPTRSSPSACSQLPEPRVLAAIKTAWRRDRKPANILLVLDTSGSMNDGGAPEAGQGGARACSSSGVEPAGLASG